MPAHRFYRFGKHYRAGLQAPERVSSVRNQGSEVSGQSMEHSRGDAAKRMSGDEGCPWRQATKNTPSCQRSRLTSNVKGGVSFAKAICETPNGKEPGYPIRQAGDRSAIDAASTCLIGLVIREKKRLKEGWPCSPAPPRPAPLPNSVCRVARPLARPRA
jgi:hypothetical protein